MAELSLRKVKKVYDNTVVAVQAFDLEIADKEFIVLVGPSGCGKSTTLRMVAGLEDITDGEIHIGGRKVNNVPPKDRDIAMVFQNYALYPHMTVYDNIAYGLKLRKFPKRVIDQKVREAAEILDITELLKRKPKALSGGQRQRVAIGRAIVREPQVFLMDEPLSNLDAKLRNQMRSEILKLRQKVNTTFIYVTHDQTEAMTLGDRIVIMKEGFVQQVGTPQEVFHHPASGGGRRGEPGGGAGHTAGAHHPVRRAGLRAGGGGRVRDDGQRGPHPRAHLRPGSGDRGARQRGGRGARGGHPGRRHGGGLHLPGQRGPRVRQGDGDQPGVSARRPGGGTPRGAPGGAGAPPAAGTACRSGGGGPSGGSGPHPGPGRPLCGGLAEENKILYFCNKLCWIS